MDSIDFYRSYHTNPINKCIHFFCIPMIVLSSINFLNKVSFKIKLPFNGKLGTKLVMHPEINVNYFNISLVYNLYYYIFWGVKVGLVMHFYIWILSIVSEVWREFDKNWVKNSIIIFVGAWIMQFLGHAIEGNRPALLTSLGQTVFEAPLFSLSYVYPSLLE